MATVKEFIVHTCGGELKPAKVKIRKKNGYYFHVFTVDGFKCEDCGEEVISRDTALAVDESINQLRQAWRGWKVPSSSIATGMYISGQVFEDDNYVRV